MMNKNCLICDETFYKKVTDSRRAWREQCKYCSRKCQHISLIGRPSPKKGKPNGSCRGANHPRWKGGITPEVIRIRRSLEHINWARAVKERDDYTCQFCGKRGGDLESDHIKSFADYPDFRFDVDNGRTLCKPCHRTTFKANSGTFRTGAHLLRIGS